MRLRMVVGFNDVEEAVSVSAATSEAKQRASVSMSFQVLACGDETAGARDVGSHIALACLKDDPTLHLGRPKAFENCDGSGGGSGVGSLGVDIE